VTTISKKTKPSHKPFR